MGPSNTKIRERMRTSLLVLEPIKKAKYQENLKPTKRQNGVRKFDGPPGDNLLINLRKMKRNFFKSLSF